MEDGGKPHRRDDAVSPVIGAILMIAVTVLIAAVVGAFVFGMASGIQKMKVVAVTATQVRNTMSVTYQGGQHDADVTNMSVQFLDNGTVFWYKTTPPFLDKNKDNAEKPAIGISVSSSGGTPAQDHVVVTAEFTDGSSQVVLDTYV